MKHFTLWLSSVVCIASPAIQVGPRILLNILTRLQYVDIFWSYASTSEGHAASFFRTEVLWSFGINLEDHIPPLCTRQVPNLRGLDNRRFNCIVCSCGGKVVSNEGWRCWLINLKIEDVCICETLIVSMSVIQENSTDLERQNPGTP
jgi:hypothetical protein